MIKKQLFQQGDFSGGYVTYGSPIDLLPNQSPDCLNVYGTASKSLKKRNGYSTLNSSAENATGNGVYNYVRTESEQYLVALFGSVLKKMDVTNSAWDGTLDTISVSANGTALSSNFMHNTTFDGDCIITTEGQDVPQKYDPNDNSGAYTNLHFGGSGTAPSGKYCITWHNRVWIANIASNLDRLAYSNDSNHTAWGATDFETITTGGDVGITGLVVLRDRLYVFKRKSIHRVTYIGGLPFVEIKEIVSTMGTGSPRSIISITTPSQGEVVLFIGTDRRKYMFNGHQSIDISESIFYPNDINDICLDNIKSDILDEIHAVNYSRKHHAVFFIPLSDLTDDDKLLLHCNGTDGSTTFTDALANHTMTANGNAQIDTAQSKFGGASALFDGTGDYLTAPDHADWNFGTGPWTIDLWFRASVLGDSYNGGFYEQHVDINNTIALYIYKTLGINFRVLSGGTIICYFESAAPLVINTWYHLAIVRYGTGQNNIYLFLDGVSRALTWYTNMAADASFPNLAAGIRIGYTEQQTSYFNGWIDEMRINKGTARWTSDFTPPTGAYGTVAHGIIYDYLLGGFWPYSSMVFSASCQGDDGNGRAKVYVQDSNYIYLFDDGNDDNGSDINAYWTCGKLDLGSEATYKQMYNAIITTNSTSATPTFKYRTNWESSYSDTETLPANTRAHNVALERFEHLLQWVFTDDSSNPAFELNRVSIVADVKGIGDNA